MWPKQEASVLFCRTHGLWLQSTLQIRKCYEKSQYPVQKARSWRGGGKWQPRNPTITPLPKILNTHRCDPRNLRRCLSKGDKRSGWWRIWLESPSKGKGIQLRNQGHWWSDLETVKCRKITEVTLGTLDIKSGPTRCWKGLQLQLMCHASCPKISEWGRWKIGDQSVGVRIGVVLRVELRGWLIKVKIYLIFKLKYLHDKSKVFILIIRINKKINQRTINKQSP